MSKGKGNSHHDPQMAIKNKKICGTCATGQPVGLMANSGQPNSVAIVPMAICVCPQSMYFMRPGLATASCQCWQKRKTESKIIVAHKPVPPLKVSDLKGE